MKELVALKARQAPTALRGAAAYSWSNRWWALISVMTQRAIAESLIGHAGTDLQPNPPTLDPPAWAEVVTDL